MKLAHNRPALRSLSHPLIWSEKKAEPREGPSGTILDAVCPHCDQRGFDCTLTTAGRVVPVCLHCGQVSEP